MGQNETEEMLAAERNESSNSSYGDGCCLTWAAVLARVFKL